MSAIFVFTCVCLLVWRQRKYSQVENTDTNTEDSGSYSAVNGRFPFHKPMKRSNSFMKMSVLLSNYIVILVRIYKKSGRFVNVSCDFHTER